MNQHCSKSQSEKASLAKKALWQTELVSSCDLIEPGRIYDQLDAFKVRVVIFCSIPVSLAGDLMTANMVGVTAAYILLFWLNETLNSVKPPWTTETGRLPCISSY